MRFIQASEYWPNQHEGEINWVQLAYSSHICYRTDGWLLTDYVWRYDKGLDGFRGYYTKLVIL